MTDLSAPVSLRDLTTMRVGGQPDRMIVANSRDELIKAATEAWDAELPWCVLAGGSNSIFSDEGYPGIVILVRSEGIELVDREVVASVTDASTDVDDERVLLRVQAGHNWDALVDFTIEQGWSGIEALSGIPGLVGAAPIQNIGAYGQEVSSSLRSVEFYDFDRREILELSVHELQLGYRSSIFKRGRRGVVLSVMFSLAADGSGLSQPLTSTQLANALGVELGTRVALADVREQVRALRALKGMIVSEDDPDTHGVGSFFVNPIVSERFAAEVSDEAPSWPAGEHEGVALVKLSAAWLIEYAGVAKGFRLPGSSAGISTKHALAITNRGGASAAQVGELARFVVQRVQQDTGVLLQPEPNLYGIEL